ncbi:MAG TPA: DNA polymerase III subunit beta [Candidatus Saccharimonadales bacterium]
MEIEIMQENLAKALQNVSRIASSKASLPILGNVLMRSENNQLRLIGTNLEMAISESVSAKILSPGSITIPARLFSDFIQNLPKEKITLSVKNTILTITSKTNTSKINGVSDEEFPEIPQILDDQSTELTIKTDVFKEFVAQTIIAASNDPTRQALTGVYLHTEASKLFAAATDGYRLAEKELPITLETDIKTIIPVSTLQEVVRSLSDEMKEISLTIDETQIKFAAEGIEIISKLIDGNFPDYRQLLPGKQDTTLVVSKTELGRVIKLSRLFSKETNGGIVLEVNDSILTVKSIASEVGENTSNIPVQHEGADGSISLNSRYMSDVLGVLELDDIEIGFSGKLSAIQLSSPGNKKDYRHIIMPIKS